MDILRGDGLMGRLRGKDVLRGIAVPASIALVEGDRFRVGLPALLLSTGPPSLCARGRLARSVEGRKGTATGADGVGSARSLYE